MAQENNKENKFKLNLFYLIAISSLVILIFFIIIFSTFWDYYSRIWRIKDFYSQEQQKTAAAYPVLNRLDPVLGPSNAKVIVFEYSDFFCPVCQDIQSTIDQIESLYGDKIQIIYKALPVTSYPEDRNATEAAYCASEQNKFWQYRTLLFQNPTALNQQTYLNYAQSLSLNTQTFSDCLSSARYESVITNNISDALKFQIDSVPTLFINGQKIEGAVTFDSLKNSIDSILNQS